jgi:ribosome-binding factor A
MKYNRTVRLAEQIKHEIANILLQQIDDPLCVEATITSVEVAPDLATARVFVSVLDERSKERTLKALQRDAKKIRTLLAHSINLRKTPELRFIYDESVIRGEKLQSLIDAAVARDEALHKE